MIVFTHVLFGAAQEPTITALLSCEEALRHRFPVIPDVIKLPLRAGLFRLLESVAKPDNSPPQPVVDAVTRLGWADKIKALLAANAPAPVVIDQVKTVSAPIAPAEVPAPSNEVDVSVTVDETQVEPTQAELFAEMCALPVSELVTVLLHNLKHLPPEPITLEKSLALTQQCCHRMIQAGDLMQRCGGVVWPAKRDDLVCRFATDPLLTKLDRAVLSDSDAHAAVKDFMLFPDLLDDDRIAQVSLQDAVLKYVTGVRAFVIGSWLHDMCFNDALHMCVFRTFTGANR
jgi:hypothetical protein